MNRRRAASVLALACAAVLTVGLAACVPEGAPAPGGATGSGATTIPATATPPASASASAPAADPAACLVGTWTMDQAALEQFYADVNAQLAGSGAAFTPSGTASLSFTPDGAFTWTQDAQVTAAVAGMTILISMSGHIDGTYTATADHLSSTTQSTDGLVVTATIDGAETDPGTLADDIAAAPVTDASYTCTPDTLTLISPIAGGTATSVLHR